MSYKDDKEPGPDLEEELEEVEELEEKLGDGKTQGTDSVAANLDKNKEFTRMDLVAEKVAKEETPKKVDESKLLQKENKTLLKSKRK